MEDLSYSIGEISKLFNIPKSKIRYWEEKEIFLPRRNNENDYRLFNLQSTIELLDVIFYRDLNVPIQKMKHFHSLSPEKIYSILEDTEQEVYFELSELQRKLEGIANRKEQLESLFALKNRGYLEEELQIEKVVTVDMGDPKDLQVQLEFLSNFTLYKKNLKDEFFQMGISVSSQYEKNEKVVIWEKSSNQKKRYITCLLEADSETLMINNLKEHEKELKSKGILVKSVIASYLATASDELEHSVDYYKAWLEVEGKGNI